MKIKHFLLTIPLMWATCSLAASPVGYWKTIDDATGKPKAIIKITEEPDKTLVGHILKILSTDAENKTCNACQGENHNKPLIGLQVLKDHVLNKSHTDEWINGSILDPKNGKTYHCNIRLVDAGRKLNVRGFLGLPLFGRTQTWVKLTEPELA